MLAGPIAVLDGDDLRKLLMTLVDRHLVLRQADGSLDVHPAIRDHFRRLASDEGKWHDIIRGQLVTLVGRPGVRYVEDKRSLDLVEEAIFHAVQAGRANDRFELYRDVLGGHPHLAWKLARSRPAAHSEDVP